MLAQSSSGAAAAAEPLRSGDVGPLDTPTPPLTDPMQGPGPAGQWASRLSAQDQIVLNIGGQVGRLVALIVSSQCIIPSTPTHPRPHHPSTAHRCPQLFHTTRATLTRIDKTFFAAMLSGRFADYVPAVPQRVSFSVPTPVPDVIAPMGAPLHPRPPPTAPRPGSGAASGAVAAASAAPLQPSPSLGPSPSALTALGAAASGPSVCPQSVVSVVDLSAPIFVDRDPTLFRHVLNYLRDDWAPLEALSSTDLVSLRREAGYYNILGLCESIDVRLRAIRRERQTELSTERECTAVTVLARDLNKTLNSYLEKGFELDRAIDIGHTPSPSPSSSSTSASLTASAAGEKAFVVLFTRPLPETNVRVLNRLESM